MGSGPSKPTLAACTASYPPTAATCTSLHPPTPPTEATCISNFPPTEPTREKCALLYEKPSSTQCSLYCTPTKAQCDSVLPCVASTKRCPAVTGCPSGQSCVDTTSVICDASQKCASSSSVVCDPTQKCAATSSVVCDATQKCAATSSVVCDATQKCVKQDAIIQVEGCFPTTGDPLLNGQDCKFDETSCKANALCNWGPLGCFAPNSTVPNQAPCDFNPETCKTKDACVLKGATVKNNLF